MSVLDRIERLRNVMEQQKIDCYIIPTDDYHHSEYVGDYFKFREYITGFTGSAGTAVFTKDKAGLWTDGSDKVYLLAAQNTAEIRAAGGFPGSIGTIRVEDGVMSIGDFNPVNDVLATQKLRLCL